MICGVYCFVMLCSLVYLLTYQLFSGAIIIVTLVHFGSYILIQIAIFFITVRNGSGLKLVSHILQDGRV